MATSRTNPLLAFGIVVVAAVVYFTILGFAAPAVRAAKPMLEPTQLTLGLVLLYIVPVGGAALLQLVLTKGVQAAAWWRVIQVTVAALLGPFVAANLVFWAWLAMGGTM